MLWLKTFQCFLTLAETTRRNADYKPQLNKLSLLFNYVSHRIYLYIEDSTIYEDAKQVLDRIYLKPKNEIFARHLLMITKQKNNESLAEFARTLKERSKDCNFQAVTAEQHRDKMMRDAFIEGLSNSSIRQRLLEKEEKLHFQEALTKAEVLDRAQRQSHSFFDSNLVDNGETKVFCASTSRSLKSIRQKCYFCGEESHPKGRRFCLAKDQTCFKCGKAGHFRRVCRSSPLKRMAAVLPHEDYLNTKEVRDHPEECSSSSTPQLFSIIASAPDSLKHCIIPCMLRGHPVDSLLDTGPSENFISDRIVNTVGLIPSGKSSKVNMASSEMSATVLGRVTSDLDVQGRTYKNLSFGIISNLCADVVLGQSFSNKHSEVLLKLEGTQKRLVIDNKPYCGVLASNFGGRRLFQNLQPDNKPIATKSRKFNDSDKTFIKNEVSHLLKEGIIEPSLSPFGELKF